jgi:addiction module HigA family antidote
MSKKNPTHPGLIIKYDCLKPLNLSVTDAAKVLGVTRSTVSKLVNGRASVSPEMAIRLSKAFGSTPEFWLKLQFNYDLAQINAKADDIKIERYQPKAMDLETEANSSARRALAQHYHDLVYILVQISEIYLYEAKLNDAQRLLNADFLKDIEDRLDPHEISRLQIQRAKVMFYRSYFGPSDHEIALAILYEAEKVASSLGDNGLLADVMDLAGSILYAKEWHSGATLDIPLKYSPKG